MKMFLRAGVVVAGAALLSAPLAANAESDHLDLGREPVHSPFADITALSVDNAPNRIVATMRMPKVNKARLTQTRLVMKTRNSPMVWRVYVSYNRKGKTTSKWITATPKPGLPAAGKRCAKIRVGAAKHRLRITVPRRCFLADATPRKPIKVRATATVRQLTPVPEDFEWTDRTPYTKFLQRGSAGGSAQSRAR